MNITLTYSSTMMLDEKIIKNMEYYGYKKEYIQKCIINNELNYCHATYYLLLNSSDLFNWFYILVYFIKLIIKCRKKLLTLLIE